MNTTLNKSYPFKVWMLTALVGPYLGVFWNVILEKDDFELSMLYGPVFLGFIGAITTLPAFYIYYLLFGFLGRKLKSAFLLKGILIIYNIAIIILLFIIFDLQNMFKPSNIDGFRFFLSIIFITILFGFLFKPYRKSDEAVWKS